MRHPLSVKIGKWIRPIIQNDRGRSCSLACRGARTRGIRLAAVDLVRYHPQAAACRPPAGAIRPLRRTLSVMPGLDPGIHLLSDESYHTRPMDCRLEAGNDDPDIEVACLPTPNRNDPKHGCRAASPTAAQPTSRPPAA